MKIREDMSLGRGQNKYNQMVFKGSNLNLTSLCLSLYYSKTNSGPVRVLFILKMANNQKETSGQSIHTYRGEGEVWGQKHKLKVDENYLSEEELLHTTEKKFSHTDAKNFKMWFFYKKRA